MGGLGCRWLSASRVRVIFLLPPDPAIREIFAPRYLVQTKLERVSIRPWSPTTVEYFPPLSYLGFRAASSHQRAGRLNKRLKVSWLGTPFLKRRNLSRKFCLARAKIATSTAVRPNPGCPPDRRKAAERGKMDGFDAVLLNRKDHQKTENIFNIRQGHI